MKKDFTEAIIDTVEWILNHWPFFLGMVGAGFIILLVCVYL